MNRAALTLQEFRRKYGRMLLTKAKTTSAEAPRQKSLWSFVEPLVVFVLFVCIVSQLCSYAPCTDPDPDGYFSYAKYLMDNGQLPAFHPRMPGYPLFLAICDYALPGSMALNAQQVQGCLTVFAVAIMWQIVRNMFTPLVGMTFLALFAAPNYFLFMSSVSLADCAFALTWLAYCLFIERLLYRMQPNKLRLIAVGLCSFMAQCLHPSFLYLILILYPCYLLTSPIFKNLPKHRLQCLAICLLVTLAASLAADLAFDRGRRVFHEHWIFLRVCLALPSVGSSPANSQIEEVKQRASERIGYRVEHECPITHPELLDLFHYQTPKGLKTYNEINSDPSLKAEFRFYPPVPPESFREIYLQRLLAYPLKFAWNVGNMLRWHYHIFLKQFLPFDSERRLNTTAYMPITECAGSKIYRTFGLDLRVGETADPGVIRAQVITALGKIGFAFSLLFFGVRRLTKGRRELPSALILTAVLWMLFISLSLPLEARYFLGFAPFLYAIFALGLVELLTTFKTLLGLLSKLMNSVHPARKKI